MPEATMTPGTLGRVRPQHLWLAVRIIVLSTTLRVALKLFGFPRVRNAMKLSVVEPLDRPAGAPAFSPAARRTFSMLERVLSRKPFKCSCLPRSMTVHRILSRSGAQVELVLGGLITDHFRAHAWVEVDGVPLETLEGGLAAWSRLVRLDLVRPNAG